MKKKNYSFRNDRKNIFALLGDNKKYLMPALFVLAVVLTVVIALNANKRTKEIAASVEDASLESTLEITEVIPMAENAYEDVNYLINEYYTALANGDADTIKSIYKGLEDTQLLKAVAASDYIEEFRVVTVYTKPGPVAGSYVAYVYNEVKLNDYDKAVPGLESLYICTDDNGNLYINGDIANANEIEYLKQVNLQEDVIDLNNKVATEYNEMVNSDEALAEFLTKMRAGLQVSVGEALASSEASSDSATEETSSDDSASEATSEAAVATVTTHTIRATDVINIRSSDSETADVISKTAKGEEFKQLEALANGWSRIEYKGGVAYVMESNFGFKMPKGMHKEFADVIQAIAEKQGEVAPESIYNQFEAQYLTAKEPFELIHYEVTDIGMDTRASVKFRYKGEIIEASAVGNGPIDAVKGALQSKVQIHAKVLDYDEHALTQGSKSKAAAYIHMVDLDTGKATYGVGISSNITRASIRGIFSALNRLY